MEPLTRNRKIYERTVKLIQRGLHKRPTEDSVALMEAVAHFASHAHTGLFRDDRLEDWLNEMGKSIQPTDIDELKAKHPDVVSTDPRPLYLHIATTLYTVGGHVNYLERIAEWDETHRHFLVVTRQEGHTCKPATIQLFEESGGGVVFLEGTYANRVSVLKTFIQLADCILLHQHTDDPTGVMALAGAGHEVGMVNHADHSFWLGVSVVQHTLEFRKESLWVSREIRGIPETRYVPLPVKQPIMDTDRKAMRKRLDIPEDAIVFASMGSAHKFRPWKDRDFFRWMDAVLDGLPGSYLVVIGMTGEEVEGNALVHRERMRWVKPTPAPGLYLVTSDFVVDPIPFGSFTAVLEGCAHGCIPILPSCSHPLFNLANDPVFKEIVVQAETPDEAIDKVKSLLKEDIPYYKERLAKLMDTFHYRKGWISHFQGGTEQGEGPIDINWNKMAEMHDHQFSKTVKRLAHLISKNAGKSLTIWEMYLLHQLWLFTGLNFVESAKWTLSTKVKTF